MPVPTADPPRHDGSVTRDHLATQDHDARPLPQLLSDRVAQSPSSAIRDLLNQAKRPGMISLAGGLPDASMFPTSELAAIARAVVGERGDEVLQYGPTPGDDEARHALRGLYGDIPIKPSGQERRGGDDVLASLVVTTGSQQALDLIARAVLNPGDSVIVGCPDYLGALQVFQSYGAALEAIAIDEAGLDTDALELRLAAGLRPRLCYVVPNFHNPTGVVMSEVRRRHLADLSARYGFLVIEDDPYGELFYSSREASAYPGDPELTARLRSTSKTLAPGLRVGALVGPEWLTQAVVKLKQSTDLHTSSLSQAVVASAITSDWYAAHLDRLRAGYRRKRDVLADALATTFGSGVHFNMPSGGMFLWAHFGAVADTATWLQRSLDHGVCFVPGSAFGDSDELASFARFSFATGSIDDLGEAVMRLERAMP